VVRKGTADTEVEGGLWRFDCLLFQKFLSELSGLAPSGSFDTLRFAHEPVNKLGATTFPAT
jgi:hypothetical protein